MSLVLVSTGPGSLHHCLRAQAVLCSTHTAASSLHQHPATVTRPPIGPATSHWAPAGQWGGWYWRVWQVLVSICRGAAAGAGLSPALQSSPAPDYKMLDAS